MPRITRAAAKADPILTDETITLSESAIADDTTAVNMDQAFSAPHQDNQGGSPQGTQLQRPPLGEVTAASGRINQIAQPESSSENSISDGEDLTPVVAVEPTSDDSAEQSENFVLILGTKPKEQKSVTSAKENNRLPNRSGKASPKNSIRVRVKDPRAQELLQQFRTATAGRGLKADANQDVEQSGAKSTTENAAASERALSNSTLSQNDSALEMHQNVPMAIKDDDKPISASPVLEEAATALKKPTKGPVTSSTYKRLRAEFWKELYEDATQDSALAKTPSLAPPEPSKMLEKKRGHPTERIYAKGQKTTQANTQPGVKSKGPTTKSKPVPKSNGTKPGISTPKVSNTKTVAKKEAEAQGKRQPQAVQKLASLFEPEPDKIVEQSDTGSPVSGVVATQPLSPLSDSKNPIEAMDALEENIEAIEKSIADCKKKSSSANTLDQTGMIPNAVDQTINSRASLAAPKAAQDKPPIRRTTIASTRTIEALNTPPKVQKSSKRPTVSNFNLSSEATAARLKTQREERQKRREEEEEVKPRKLKPKSVKAQTRPVEVRMTAASRARMSLAANKPNISDTAAKTAASAENRRSTTLAPATVARVQGFTTASSRKSQSISPLKRKQGVVAVTDIAGIKTISHSTAKPTPHPSSVAQRMKLSQTSNTLRQSLPNAAAKSGNAGTVHVTSKRTSMATQRAKPSTSSTVYPNIPPTAAEKPEKRTRELTVSEKAEAAKKARLEAAERGRAASREWAERKKRATASSKSQTVSGSTSLPGTYPIKEIDEGEEDKENKEDILAATALPTQNQPVNNESSSFKTPGLAESILLGDTASQDDAAYIVAEKKRIEKLRSIVSQAGHTDNECV